MLSTHSDYASLSLACVISSETVLPCLQHFQFFLYYPCQLSRDKLIKAYFESCQFTKIVEHAIYVKKMKIKVNNTCKGTFLLC